MEWNKKPPSDSIVKNNLGKKFLNITDIMLHQEPAPTRIVQFSIDTSASFTLLITETSIY